MPQEEVEEPEEEIPAEEEPTDEVAEEPSQDDQELDMELDSDISFGGNDDDTKMVQRLTGKLAQLLRQVQEKNETPDVGLAKYVAGMIISASIEHLDEAGVEDIYDKFREKAEELKEEDDFVPHEDDEE